MSNIQALPMSKRLLTPGDPDMKYGPFDSLDEFFSFMDDEGIDLYSPITVSIKQSDGTIKEFWNNNTNSLQTFVEKQNASFKTINNQTITGTGNINIPRGEQGLPGEDGQDGQSAKLKVERISTGVKVTATDADGQTVAILNDGVGSDAQPPLIKAESVDGGVKITTTDREGSTEAILSVSSDGATFPDAPTDNKSYLRKNGAWVAVEVTGGSEGTEGGTVTNPYNLYILDVLATGVTGTTALFADNDEVKTYFPNGIIPKDTEIYFEEPELTSESSNVFIQWLYDGSEATNDGTAIETNWNGTIKTGAFGIIKAPNDLRGLRYGGSNKTLKAYMIVQKTTTTPGTPGTPGNISGGGSSSGGSFIDAPYDDNVYGRQNGMWVQLNGTSSGGSSGGGVATEPYNLYVLDKKCQTTAGTSVIFADNSEIKEYFADGIIPKDTEFIFENPNETGEGCNMYIQWLYDGSSNEHDGVAVETSYMGAVTKGSFDTPIKAPAKIRGLRYGGGTKMTAAAYIVVRKPIEDSGSSGGGTGVSSAKAAPNRWYGKTWLVCGDSISTENNGYASSGYGDAISKSLGMRKTNVAVGGRLMKDIYTQQIQQINKHYDLITVMGGTNDAGFINGIYAGDSGNYPGHELVVEMENIINYVRNNFPDSTLIFITPIHRYTKKVDGTVNAQTDRLKPYVAAIKETCSKYGVPCIDIFDSIYPENDYIRLTYFCQHSGTGDEPLGDGIHPNVKGHKRFIAPIIEQGILKHAPFEILDTDGQE